jgi:hypothetical protein
MQHPSYRSAQLRFYDMWHGKVNPA